ncbi:MAG: undecaprenyl/decaprenyl-phosphate alpha-N-acetylglucosaminyl 1-phosphate transferase [Magnetovibrio sp.]|nr:undecaprenyl/decaprenyl-phosphate alpha-N-acetylglucosaminyl 1-phosphate transferase [Magnetovibrio sp.]
MTFSEFLFYAGFGAALLALAALLTWLLMKRVRIIDVPNERSSHSRPTPRSGGIAIVVTFFAGLGAMWAISDSPVLGTSYFWGFCGAAFVIAAVSIFDDLSGLSFKVKLLLQTGCSAWVMALGVVADQVYLPFIGLWELGWLAYPVTLVWIIGLTNAFNFMDGIDGISGGTAIIASGFFAFVMMNGGSAFLHHVVWIVLWASLGFLLWNWQPAKIFMGDSGSQFLGFILAIFAVMAGQFDESHVPYVVMPLLFFHYMWDTVYTFVRRYRAGEAVTEAHRSHLYQLMNRLGMSHARVTLTYLGIGALQGLGALVLVQLPPEWQLLVFVPFIGLQWGLTRNVVRRARAQGLIA